ncbi:hypothetical protein GLYMA_08G019200v4 [Glycine max]|uniref:Uncharacterized protein n=1 Tax=Glycine max TaxID=3847 RepID=K7L4G6_SOYBN|nr:hypothetical protein JHK85_020662 [Glycine max]KAG5024309.1 hypothetical protein JHK86_020223 [Glycine max]KAH1049170.1 hypothetical protein GYH30_019967 [Glycine max]KRH41253.1 hypothetical protein GLYMA_08G019200v4 [Glycine max]
MSSMNRSMLFISDSKRVTTQHIQIQIKIYRVQQPNSFASLSLPSAFICFRLNKVIRLYPTIPLPSLVLYTLQHI